VASRRALHGPAVEQGPCQPLPQRPRLETMSFLAATRLQVTRSRRRDPAGNDASASGEQTRTDYT
jgi:hypothetical protein